MDIYDAAARIFDLDEGRGLPGREGMPYQDTKGNWTIGKGHLIGKYITDLKLSSHMIEELFKEDVNKAINESIDVVGADFYAALTPARQLALVSMLFTLGENKFLKFNETIAAMKRHDWDEVAKRILQSKWARDVDPKQREKVGRDDRVAYMFQTGEYHPDYGIKSS